MKAPKPYAFYGFLIGIIAGVLLNLPIMFYLFTALAGLWYANVIQALKTGKITTLISVRYGGANTYYNSSMKKLPTYFRDKNPFLFWFSVLLEIVSASLCIFYLKQEGYIIFN